MILQTNTCLNNEMTDLITFVMSYREMTALDNNVLRLCVKSVGDHL